MLFIRLFSILYSPFEEVKCPLPGKIRCLLVVAVTTLVGEAVAGIRIDIEHTGTTREGIELCLEFMHAVDGDGDIFLSKVPKNLRAHHFEIIGWIKASVVHDRSPGSQVVFCHLVRPAPAEAPSDGSDFFRVYIGMCFQEFDSISEIPKGKRHVFAYTFGHLHGDLLVRGRRLSIEIDSKHYVSFLGEVLCKLFDIIIESPPLVYEYECRVFSRSGWAS